STLEGASAMVSVSVREMTTGARPAQTPPVHRSGPVAPSPSSHGVPSGATSLEQTPVWASQLPARWQASEAAQTTPVHGPLKAAFTIRARSTVTWQTGPATESQPLQLAKA